jgi:molybdopterin-guanine dinucleotide biosynthesis protein
MNEVRELSDIIQELVRRPERRRSFRSHSARRHKRLMRSWVYDGTEVSKKFMEQSKDIFIGASDVSDYIINDILLERNARCINTDHSEVTVLASAKDWLSFVNNTGLRVVKFSSERGACISDEDLSYFSYDINSSTIRVNILGYTERVSEWVELITSKFERVHNVIDWIYNTDGQSIEVPLRGDRVPLEEMYPWLDGESLTDYYDRFMHSDASILLLIGPPGTGKTTFIRGLLQHTKQSAVVTYDPTILAKDFVFAQFIEGDRNVFVIEDADNFLGARTDGNDIMHKFLNVGDGLVTTKNKKLIFSTNLPSVRDIDPALIRPGRCFDIANFDLLTTEQAGTLADKLGVVFVPDSKTKYSIADIFHKQTQATKSPKRKFGFV